MKLRTQILCLGLAGAALVSAAGGIGLLGETISQMDRVTQQNAALVEESAAAADSLKQQALQLVQAVAVFKLDREPRMA